MRIQHQRVALASSLVTVAQALSLEAGVLVRLPQQTHSMVAPRPPVDAQQLAT